MALPLYTNNASGLLVTAITAGDTSIEITPGHGVEFPSPTGGDYAWLTLSSSTAIEIVKCTARTGDVFTVVRGQQSTSATSFAIGDTLDLRMTAQGLTDNVTLAAASAAAALVSENNAGSSASAASASALISSTQASNAATSASNAATSETNAATSASTATTQATNSGTYATLSEEWANKTTGVVAAAEYSSKAYAVGGTGVTGSSGAAKEWAITTGGTVNGVEYSAKHYATASASSASNASTSASNASASETNAATSASNAATSETNAGISETNAAASEAQSAVNATVRVVAMADATSFTPTADTADQNTQANTQALGTLTANAPSGTPVNGQRIIIRIKSTNVQTFAWNAIYRGSTELPLPTATTGATKTDYFGFIYNTADSKWDLVAKVQGF